MVCQICGQARPTTSVTLLQNIGMFARRSERKLNAKLCRTCIDAHFWEFNAINTSLGWWGVISFLATFGFIINNWVQFFRTRSLPASHNGLPAAPLPGQIQCPNCRTFQQQPAKRATSLYVAIAVGAFLLIGGIALQIAPEGPGAGGQRGFGVFLIVIGALGLFSGLMALRSRFVRCLQCSYQWPIR